MKINFFFPMLFQKLIVMKSATVRKCYAYKMQNHEATPDEIKAGVLQVDKLLV